MQVHNSGPKIQREQATITLMIRLYCRKQHGNHTALCTDCQQLLTYALRRLTLCRFGEQKTTCAKCPRHCYRSNYKANIQKIMRYAGPRMLIYHPIYALEHMIKGIKTTVKATSQNKAKE